MRIGIITSRYGSLIVKNLLREFKDVDLKVIELPIDFITNIYIEDILQFIDPKIIEDLDIIIFPGTILGDVGNFTRKFKIKAIKGTKNISELPIVIKALRSGIELSSTLPADYLLPNHKKEFEEEILQDFRKSRRVLLSIGDESTRIIEIRENIPIILAEIIDATLRSEEEVLKIAKYYVSEGADIIDIGASVIKAKPEKVRRLVRLIKRELKVPVSIDSFNKDEIETAIEADVNLILSVTSRTIEKYVNYEIPIVLIPDTHYEPEETINYFKKVLDVIESKKHVILDPILKAPCQGLGRSLTTYYLTRKYFPENALLMGVGNVTELYDADSIGINALLASIAVELNINLLLTTEASYKTIRAVSELKKAIDMSVRAYAINKTPKDMSINLLICKKKLLST